ncbi:YbaK/EbsC family protein [bacterium]|nr:YbaK/EbsC family protein [bacterium]
MPARLLKEFLDSHGVKYETIPHTPAYTAQEIAATAHIPGKEMAKTVVVKLDGKMAMAVLPACNQLSLERLRAATHAGRAELAGEVEFKDRFPGCEIGAMPPFGNLFDMPVYVARKLVEDEEIAFNAGSHTEVVKMQYKDFERLVHPQVVEMAM